ncbi:MAG: hypothetical protein IT285_07235 [Bdellovibrionales bacterium]|nr:hypothetical protein [Bdellovibrionales bacterium]
MRAGEVRGCLHLKTACTWIGGNTLLLDPEWVEPGAFEGFASIAVDPLEPFAANVLKVGEALLYSSAFPRRLERIGRAGFEPALLDISELQKAEAGLTCLSQLIA